MKSAILALLSFGSAALASPASGDTGKTLDLAGVTAVVISGEASSVRLTASASAPYQVTIGSRREGWFARWYSSWFANDCRSASDMKLEASTLRIDVAPSSWLDPSDCRVEINANMQPESSVSIDQAALQASMTGNFSTIAITSKAADVSLDGHASSVDLRGDALKAISPSAASGRTRTSPSPAKRWMPRCPSARGLRSVIRSPPPRR
ncbi:hypothetical protein C1D09_018385 [Mesorhizobium intechi]|uniref:Auto-transporter adhesin head GIN domain-containing protein n=1 Tax=Mesorhizobium intechi TaxID=537601 RepID=A0A8T9AP78_9HYPH|nr:hypothetical protein [Mesorhizobium intechi]TSE07503.1 hypothetical protein C1D09_018385 [Mesorhizobium intechi]